MNKIALEEIIKQAGKDEILYEAYKNKMLNMYISYQINLNEEVEYKYGNEKDKNGLLPLEIQEDYDIEHNYIDSESIALFCSDLCISIDKFKVHKVTGLYQFEYPYTSYKTNAIWRYIEELDSIEFLIATLSLMINTPKHIKFGKWLAVNVKKTLKEYDIDYILDSLISKRVFIAMSFDPSLMEAREKIKQAVRESGYEAVLIDEKEHSNSIVPEIFYEIEKCNFVISDFTGNRGGVYYESGYAKALGKKIIMTVNDKDFDNIHFDTKQVSHIKWKDEEDLYKRLLKRIEVENL